MLQVMTKTVDAQTVEDAVASMRRSDIDAQKRLSDADAKTIARAVDNAQKAMAAISRFTGREIGEAVVMEAAHVKGQQGGRMAWKAGSDVGKAMKWAIQTQSELSQVLHAMLRSSSLDGEHRDRILDMALQCDRRGCEIVTLATELARTVSGAKGEVAGDQSPPPDSRIANHLDQRMDEIEGAIHGTGEVFEGVKERLEPLERFLDDYAARPNASLTDEELTACTLVLTSTSAALKKFAESDILVSSKTPQNLSSLRDKGMLTFARALVDAAANKLSDVKKHIGERMLRHFADTVFAFPKELARFRTAKIDEQEQSSVWTAVRLRNELHAAALAYIEDPSDANEHTLDDICERYAQTDPQTIALETNFTAICDVLGDGDEEYDELSKVLCAAPGMRTQLAQFKLMVDNVRRNLAPEQLLTTTSARALIEGRLEFATLVEARVHGMSDDDVNPALDDSRLESSHPLGSGVFNTVSLIKYKDDDAEYVFKPEAPGRQLLGASILYSGTFLPEEQLAQRNLATQDAARALGVEDVIPRCSVGMHKGQYGLFMTKAPGQEGMKFANGEQPAEAGHLSIGDVSTLGGTKHFHAAGSLMRQINRLEWLDLITGLDDRHGANYLVDVQRNGTVTVTGIDNDLCFSARRVGLCTYDLRGAEITRFDELCEQIVMAYPKRHRDQVRARLGNDPGVDRSRPGVVRINASELAAGELLFALNGTCGMTSTALPTYIDQDVYNRLMALEFGTEERAQYLAALRKRLPFPAYEAAVNRLNEAIALARKLQSTGRCVTASQFDQPAVQSDLLLPEQGRANPVKPIGSYSLSRDSDIVKMAKEMTQSIYMRDNLMF